MKRWSEIVEAAHEVRALAEFYDAGRFALGLSGSASKGTADDLSDVDFRCYSDNPRPALPDGWNARWESLAGRWRDRGLVLDGLGWTTVSAVDAAIDSWLSGAVVPDDIIWTIWGYHPLTDYHRQIAVIDDHGLIEGWRGRLEPYPRQMGQAIIVRHLRVLRYWRGDYHYRNKVRRADEVFLAGLTSLLIHHVLQVLCAVNGVYYPGDGNNLALARQLPVAPDELDLRIRQALAPPSGERRLHVQREIVVALIDDVERVVATI